MSRYGNHLPNLPLHSGVGRKVTFFLGESVYKETCASLRWVTLWFQARFRMVFWGSGVFQNDVFLSIDVLWTNIYRFPAFWSSKSKMSRINRFGSLCFVDLSLCFLLLDTPCTAGARRRWDYANLPLTTTPNLLDSSTFLSTDAIHVRNMFFQEFKKGAQKWIQNR